MISNIPDSWFTLAGVLFGGAAMKLIEVLSRSRGKRIDAAAKLRDELWKELMNQREELGKLRGELDEWKRKYFDLYAIHLELKGRYEKDHLQDELQNKQDRAGDELTAPEGLEQL